MKEEKRLLTKYRYRREWREKYMSLNDIYGWTIGGKYAKRVNAARGLDEVMTEAGMTSGPVVAEELPRVYPSVGEKGAYTGLVLLSLRISDGQKRLEQLRQVVNVWEQTLLSFMGTSGQSLKVVIPYCLPDGTLPIGEQQVALFRQYAYRRAADYVLNATGLKAEEVAHDGKESFRISFDPKAYLNLEAKPITMVQPTAPLTERSAPVIGQSKEPSLDTEVLPGYTRREMDATKYNFICRQLAYGQELELADYLMRLATKCRNAGIDAELAIKLTLDTSEFCAKETLVRTTFTNAYERHRLGQSQPIEKVLMHQQLLEHFLHRRYMFRRNRVTGEVEYQEKYRYMLWWKPLTEEARNDINNAAIREGIKVWPRDLERLLVSERIDEYDPVREWLDQLPRWDGRDRLGELADRVPTQAPGWRDNFKVWMRSMVSQWRSGAGALYGAQMVFMLVGGQGTRKSTFMRMLLPRELMMFYIDRIDFANRKEAMQALARFLLINIDEYDQVSKAQTAFLKHLIQRTDVKERKLYTTTFEQSQRYATFCATTNALTPLRDDSGSRRYMVVEVNGVIDTDTTGEKAIDYQQLYAQIVHEIEAGEDYAFTGERESLIMEHNADYSEVPHVVSLFDDLYRHPQAGDEVLWLSPTEILTNIRDVRHVNVITRANATMLGSYLVRQGYLKGHGEKLRRCYAVARKG